MFGGARSGRGLNYGLIIPLLRGVLLEKHPNQAIVEAGASVTRDDSGLDGVGARARRVNRSLDSSHYIRVALRASDNPGPTWVKAGTKVDVTAPGHTAFGASQTLVAQQSQSGQRGSGAVHSRAANRRIGPGG
jgi:hypothetical protein